MKKVSRLVWQLILFGLAMGANNGLAAVALGTSQLPRIQQWKTAIIFAFFEAFMPVLGMFVGEELAGSIGQHAKWIGIAVLAAMGVYSLLKRDAEDDETEKVANAGVHRILFLAIALSLDNLTVGFGLGMFHVPLILAACVFGFVSFLMTVIGLEVGRFIGKRVSVSADRLSGAVLLIVAGFMAFA